MPSSEDPFAVFAQMRQQIILAEAQMRAAGVSSGQKRRATATIVQAAVQVIDLAVSELPRVHGELAALKAERQEQSNEEILV